MPTDQQPYSTDPADLFSQLYDELPERLFASEEEAEAWLTDDAVAEIAADVERQVVSTGRVDAETLERFLDVADRDRNCFAVLLGLDQAFMQVDLVTGTYDVGGLTELALRYLETGRLSTAAVTGAVLPKVAVPAQEHLLPESIRDAFASAIRVPIRTPIEVTPHLLEHWPSRSARESGEIIAALPAFDRDAPLEIARVDQPVPSYRLRIGQIGDPRGWVSERLAALDAAGAHMAILPELALTPELLDAWQDACRTTHLIRATRSCGLSLDPALTLTTAPRDHTIARRCSTA